MSNFFIQMYDSNQKTWSDRLYWPTVFVCALGLGATIVGWFGGASAERVQPPLSVESSGFTAPNEALRNLFGQNIRATDFGDPVPGVVLEPIRLDGIIWRDSVERSYVILSYRDSTKLTKLGASVFDGSVLVDISPGAIVLARNRHREVLNLPTATKLRLSENPFTEIVARLRRGESSSTTWTTISTQPSTDEVLTRLGQIRSVVAQVPPPAAPRPQIQRRQGNRGRGLDARFQHLHPAVCQEHCPRSQ